MSQPEKRVEAVAALIAERRKYEGWLAALEAKRAETPDHVFFRVRSDYERRLSEILERLRSQASALNERADALNLRLAALVQQERASQDRRHEAELRVSVGEFSQKAWDALLKETADTVARIAAERTTIQAELAEIRELLGAGKPTGSGKALSTTPLASDPPELPPDELAFLRSLITPEVGSKVTGANAPAPGPPPLQSSGVVKESEPLLDPKRSGRDTPPLSMNVPGSESIVIRSDKDGKTLKCAECGALNVPTEWYCEQCGSELAPS
jgi:primosomal protein N'